MPLSDVKRPMDKMDGSICHSLDACLEMSDTGAEQLRHNGWFRMNSQFAFWLWYKYECQLATGIVPSQATLFEPSPTGIAGGAEPEEQVFRRDGMHLRVCYS
jgi:hypothetical protein